MTRLESLDPRSRSASLHSASRRLGLATGNKLSDICVDRYQQNNPSLTRCSDNHHSCYAMALTLLLKSLRLAGCRFQPRRMYVVFFNFNDYLKIFCIRQLSYHVITAFPVTAARLWNSLPSHVTAASLSGFLGCCSTHLERPAARGDDVSSVVDVIPSAPQVMALQPIVSRSHHLISPLQTVKLRYVTVPTLK